MELTTDFCHQLEMRSKRLRRRQGVELAVEDTFWAASNLNVEGILRVLRPGSCAGLLYTKQMQL